MWGKTKPEEKFKTITWNCSLYESESESLSVMSHSLQPHGICDPWNSPGQNTGVGSLPLLQGIFPTQGSNQGLLHYRRILSQLSQKGSPRILEWAAFPSSRGSSRPRNRTGVSIAGGSFPSWARREATCIKNTGFLLRVLWFLKAFK